MKKKAIVCGAGGFIGGHMVKYLLKEGYVVAAVDVRPYEDWDQVHEESINQDKFDLRNAHSVESLVKSAQADELYQFAADMGGAGYIFTGEHDADVMHNSALVNLNVAHAIANHSKHTKVFYSSSACMYPEHNQLDPDNPKCTEDSAYPANPDSEYGWEKLFSERLYAAYSRNHDIPVRVARFHNIFGPLGTWDGGREKLQLLFVEKLQN